MSMVLHAPSTRTSPSSATLGSYAVKTSVTKLKEFCNKECSGDPIYTELPVFRGQGFQYSVTVNPPHPVTARGKVCRSKKDARHSAAQKALQKLE